MLFSLSSCKLKFHSTFPSNQIAANLQHLCATDYKLPVETRHEGKTLQAFMRKVGLFNSPAHDLQGINKEAMDAIEHVLLCATRVALSTDAPLDFVEVKMSDVLTGATITLWRYVPDIRDSMYQRIGDTEYFSRLVIEIDAGAAVRADSPLRQTRRSDRPAVTADVQWDKPLTMSEFLAKQIILRARHDGGESLQAHADLSQPATLGVIIENWPAIEEEGPDRVAKVTDGVHKSAQTVVKGYRFRGFHGLTLRDGEGVALNSWTL